MKPGLRGTRYSSWIVLFALLVAVVLAFFDPGLGRTLAGVDLVAGYVTGDLPLDPDAGSWNGAGRVRTPLSSVNLRRGSARAVTVSALYNGKEMAFRLQWADSTEDVGSMSPKDFPDAAAVQIAGRYATDICMGQVGKTAHIWQWKANREKGTISIARQYPRGYRDDYSLVEKATITAPAAEAGNLMAVASGPDAAVEHLVAGGFGSLTTAADQLARGKSAWGNDQWAVVIRVPVQGGDLASIARPGSKIQAAFAVWDGSNMERDGRKATTAWITLRVPGAVNRAVRWSIPAAFLLAGLSLWVGRGKLSEFMGRKPRVGPDLRATSGN